MNYEGNASYLYIGNVASGADGTIKGNAIAAGSVAFVDEAGVTVNAATTTGKLRIAKKSAAGKMNYSPYFDMAKLINPTGGESAVPVQQLSYIGYNETDGSLTVEANADYVVNIEWSNTSGMYNNKPLLLTGMFHTSAASQQELAEGLVASLNATISRQDYPFVVASAVDDGSGNYGIKLLGAENTKSFDPLTEQWSVTRFKILTGDFPEAEVRTKILAGEGSGYGKQIANIEAYSQFLSKDMMLSSYPQTKISNEAGLTSQYDVCSFEVSEIVNTSVGTGISTSNSFRISVATEVSLTGDDIDTVLGVTV